MASKKSTSKKAVTNYPCVRTFPLYDDTNTYDRKILQVDRLLSQMNHRLYRQTRDYELKLDLNPNSGDQYIEVYVLADTWALRKSVQLAKKMYDENTKEERAGLGGKTARWEDFRIDHGVENKDLVFSGRTTSNLAATVFSAGEYQLSKVVDEADTERTFTLTTTSTGTQYQVIGEYDASGNQDTDPSSPTAQGAYNGLTTSGDAQVALNLQTDGNDPPYNGDTFTGTKPWIRIATIGRGQGGAAGRMSTGFFKAPLGMVIINNVTNTNELTCTVKKGDYKGVHAPSMLE